VGLGGGISSLADTLEARLGFVREDLTVIGVRASSDLYFENKLGETMRLLVAVAIEAHVYVTEEGGRSLWFCAPGGVRTLTGLYSGV